MSTTTTVFLEVLLALVLVFGLLILNPVEGGVFDVAASAKNYTKCGDIEIKADAYIKAGLEAVVKGVCVNANNMDCFAVCLGHNFDFSATQNPKHSKPMKKNHKLDYDYLRQELGFIISSQHLNQTVADNVFSMLAECDGYDLDKKEGGKAYPLQETADDQCKAAAVTKKCFDKGWGEACAGKWKPKPRVDAFLDMDSGPSEVQDGPL